MKFVHLHVHSHYSILDGMSKVPDLVNKAMRCGMNSIALTDHGNMFGTKELVDYVSKVNGKTKDKIKELQAEFDNVETSAARKEELQAEIEKQQQRFFKPIIGVEAYCARRSLYSKDKDFKMVNPESGREQIVDASGYHLILLAKNKKGYQNLCKLVSVSWVDGNYYRPRIDKELLEKYHEGIIASSACLGGEIPQLIIAGKLDEAEKSILWFKKLFGDDYYIELQRHKTNRLNADTSVYKRQEEVIPHLVELARKTNTKIIATNDVHFVEESHAEAHDRLICLSTGKDLDDPNRMRYTKQEWLKSPEEMAEIFSDYPEAIANTQELAEKVEVFTLNSDPIMPKFEIPETFGTEADYREKYTEQQLFDEFTRNEKGEVVLSQEDAEKKIKKLGGYDKLYRIKLEADYLAKLAWEGAIMRYGETLTDEQHDRIVFELHIMKTMGFPGYFLIVQDYIRAAREELNVSVGPGRGSAAGSVVAYCLKITDIDPLKYDLLFERFLNPDRISLPDIDVDFDDDGRALVLDWVTKKYGREKVAHIITYGTMATKSSIADVGRVQKVPLSKVNEIKSFVPDKFSDNIKDEKGKTPKPTLTNCLKYIPELQSELHGNDQNVSTMLEYAEELEGTIRQIGIHACGVIIGADDLTNFAPLSTVKDRESGEDVLVTEYDGHVVEQVGLIKMDFLGLSTLSIIKEALSNIKKSKGIELDIDTIPIDDEETYKLYSEGRTIGTFQFESAGMQKYLRELKPSVFEDLIAMNALYRPGPMDYIPQFIARKQGREPITYDIPVMERYLKDTYGVTVYQEQVMLLSRLLADFTRGESDALRKAMGKKLIAVLNSLKPKFIEGGKKNGHDPKILEKIWQDWEKFASYAFNKSHATCYSWVSYQTAYLKAHYPAEFMAANLTRNKDNITDVSKFMDECKKMGILVLGPDVNKSELNFTVNEDGNIRFGLGGVKGVGEGAVESILAERSAHGKFKDIFDFVERVNLSSCNKKTLESLAFSGSFDAFSDTYREQYFVKDDLGKYQFNDAIVRYGNRFQSDSAFMQNSLFGDDNSVAITKPALPKVETWNIIERLNYEKNLVGIFLSAHPLDDYYVEINAFCNANLSDLTQLEPLQGKELIFGGMLISSRTGMTKTGNPYGGFVMEDFSGTYEFMLWGGNYMEYSNFLNQKDIYIMVRGVVQDRRAEWKHFVPKEGEPLQLEFKIKKITLLNDVCEKEAHLLTLHIPIESVDENLVEELDQAFLSTSANNVQGMHLEIKLTEQDRSFVTRSSTRRAYLDKDLKTFLRNKKMTGVLDFSLS